MHKIHNTYKNHPFFGTFLVYYSWLFSTACRFLFLFFFFIGQCFLLLMFNELKIADRLSVRPWKCQVFALGSVPTRKSRDSLSPNARQQIYATGTQESRPVYSYCPHVYTPASHHASPGIRQSL